MFRASTQRGTLPQLVEFFPHGIAEHDLSGNITFANTALHNILGYSIGELQGQSIWDLIVSHDEQRATLVIQQPKQIPYTTKYRTKQGKTIDVQIDWNYRTG